MKEYDVDIDQRKIYIEGDWFTMDQLSQKIQGKLGQGDFKISALSDALEKLRGVLESMRELSISVTAEIYDAYQDLARNRKDKVEQVARRALAFYLTSDEAGKDLFTKGVGAAAQPDAGAEGEPVFELKKKKG